MALNKLLPAQVARQGESVLEQAYSTITDLMQGYTSDIWTRDTIDEIAEIIDLGSAASICPTLLSREGELRMRSEKIVVAGQKQITILEEDAKRAKKVQGKKSGGRRGNSAPSNSSLSGVDTHENLIANLLPIDSPTISMAEHNDFMRAHADFQVVVAEKIRRELGFILAAVQKRANEVSMIERKLAQIHLGLQHLMQQSELKDYILLTIRRNCTSVFVGNVTLNTSMT